MEENVNPVHQLYMDLSGRYKAGWTFHRFIQGLRKFFGGQDLDDHTADFQELYAGLREVSKQLNDLAIQPVIDRLEGIQARLDGLLDLLGEEDRRVDPSLVRLFFRRVKTYDERILLDLIRFFIEIQRGRSWESERIDKVDYLISRLAESVAGEKLDGDRNRLTRVLGNLSERLAPRADVDPQRIANRQRMIEAVRREIDKLESFEELTERDLVGHYRQVKHGLGNLLFERSILPVIVETNLALARRIRSLSHEEEKRILEDYERISRLEQEGGVDRDLSDAVNRLHLQVSHFRKQLGAGNVRLGDMTVIRQSVVEILEQIDLEAREPSEVREETGIGSQLRRLEADEAIPVRAERLLIGAVFEDLVTALTESDSVTAGQRQLDARALQYRLEERELEAFERLAGGGDCDEALEQFLLAGAALRHRINEEVNEIHSYRSRVGEREALPERDTEAILSLGDLYLRRFAHYSEGSPSLDRGDGPVDLQVLRMRLMRDYSGLWLVANA